MVPAVIFYTVFDVREERVTRDWAWFGLRLGGKNSPYWEEHKAKALPTRNNKRCFAYSWEVGGVIIKHINVTVMLAYKTLKHVFGNLTR